MKKPKLKNEAALMKEALRIGGIYAKKRGAGEIESHDSADLKVEFVYKLLVHDKLIQPLAKDKISTPNMKNKLALWMARQLPENHPLLQD